MKRPSPRAVLAVSLAVIALRWAWQLATLDSATTLPDTFAELAWQIARNKIVLFAVIVVLLRLGGERFDALGLRFAGWAKQVGLGIAWGCAMFLALNVALSAALQAIFPQPTGGPSVLRFFADPMHLAAWLPIGIFGGGVVEELERIFILTRFEHWLGRKGLVLGVVLSSITFGLGHLYQGIGTALSVMVSGLVFALLYLRRRSALEPIVAHAWSDVLAVLAATLLHH